MNVNVADYEAIFYLKNKKSCLTDKLLYIS